MGGFNFAFTLNKLKGRSWPTGNNKTFFYSRWDDRYYNLS